eukprot:UN33550
MFDIPTATFIIYATEILMISTILGYYNRISLIFTSIGILICIGLLGSIIFRNHGCDIGVLGFLIISIFFDDQQQINDLIALLVIQSYFSSGCWKVKKTGYIDWCTGNILLDMFDEYPRTYVEFFNEWVKKHRLVLIFLQTFSVTLELSTVLIFVPALRIYVLLLLLSFQLGIHITTKICFGGAYTMLLYLILQHNTYTTQIQFNMINIIAVLVYLGYQLQI